MPLPLPNPLTKFDDISSISLRPPQGVDVQNLIKIDSAVAALRMREKRGFAWVFCLHIRLSIYPYFTTPTGHIFSATLTFNGSYEVFLQPLVPFRGHDEIAPHLGVKSPKKAHFGA